MTTSDGVALKERALPAESPPAADDARTRLVRRLLRNPNVIIGGSVFLLLVLVALFADALSPYSPTRLYPAQRLKPPGLGNLLGTDEFGRDIASLVLHGSRDTLIHPSGGRHTAEIIPGARYHEIEGMGHDYPPAAWPEWVRTWADFVAEVSPAPAPG